MNFELHNENEPEINDANSTHENSDDDESVPDQTEEGGAVSDADGIHFAEEMERIERDKEIKLVLTEYNLQGYNLDLSDVDIHNLSGLEDYDSEEDPIRLLKKLSNVKKYPFNKKGLDNSLLIGLDLMGNVIQEKKRQWMTFRMKPI